MNMLFTSADLVGDFVGDVVNDVVGDLAASSVTFPVSAPTSEDSYKHFRWKNIRFDLMKIQSLYK